jgi:hypothetical protein
MISQIEKLDRFHWISDTDDLRVGDRVWVAVAYHAADGDVWTIEDIKGETLWIRSVLTGNAAIIRKPNEIRREQS